MRITLPKEADALLAAIRAAGGQGYVVGGALRDLLRGETPADWDFAATLPTETLLKVLPGARLIGGVCGTVQLPFGAAVCEVTPCRTEGAYSDRRHPDTVHFVPDIRADLARRDFTINAMAWDGQELTDPYGGRQDIENRQLRCVGSPAQRFSEDPLRILRLFRFAAVLGFSPEKATLAAAKKAAGSIATLSRERVRAELERILLSTDPAAMAPLLKAGGLAGYGLAYDQPLAPLAQMPRRGLCRWWGLLALCGADTDRVSGAFRFSARFVSMLNQYTRLYRLGPAQDLLVLKQKLQDVDLPEGYAPTADTFAAISPKFRGEPALFAALEAAQEPYRLKDLAINGDMLRYAGIRGEACGQVLHELLGLAIRDPALNTAPVLMELAKGIKSIL